MSTPEKSSGTASQTVVKRIVVGIDGSDHAAAALEFAIGLARPLKAEIVAVFAVPPAQSVTYGGFYGEPIVLPDFSLEELRQLKRDFRQEWCRTLRDSGLEYKAVAETGSPAAVIAAIAEREQADLVVVGRRGRGGLAELVLGSVSHELSHHCTRPVLLISKAQTESAEQPLTTGAPATAARTTTG
jgi:nucleotide-binding universal stress UspA family protein